MLTLFWTFFLTVFVVATLLQELIWELSNNQVTPCDPMAYCKLVDQGRQYPIPSDLHHFIRHGHIQHCAARLPSVPDQRQHDNTGAVGSN